MLSARPCGELDLRFQPKPLFPWLSSWGQVEERAQGARTSASMSLGWPGDSLPGGSRRQEWAIWGFNLSLL